ncbi:MAG: ESPR-type extended signal peptide-containing protein, partial [Acidaminococcaceae bacterium]|nr:ESPR-type extended signal peptide-containing protein [Acidaminococcaceae bacterium]
MNKIYKVVWSKARNCYVVVSEYAKSNSRGTKVLAAALISAFVVGSAGNVYAATAATAPSGGGNVKSNGTDVLVETGASNVFVGAEAKGNNGNGSQTVAVGYKADATNANATAIGALSQALQAAVALGINSKAMATHALSIGSDSLAEGEKSIAIGQGSKARNEGSLAIGAGAEAKGGLNYGVKNGAIAIGSNATIYGGSFLNSSNGKVYSAGGRLSTAIGASALGGLIYKDNPTGGVVADFADTRYNMSSGNITVDAANFEQNIFQLAGVDTGKTTLRVNEVTAIGADSRAIGDQSIAIGAQAIAGHSSVAIGGNDYGNVTSDAQKKYKLLVKENLPPNQVGGIYSTTSAMDGSVAIGIKSFSRSSLGTALGMAAQVKRNADLGTAIGSGAIVGDGITATDGGVSIGAGAKTLNNYTSAIGTGANAIKERATAVGFNAHADGENALAYGSKSVAKQDNTVAIGTNAVADAAVAVALGGSSVAKGDNSMAIGSNAATSGTNAIAIGTFSEGTGSSSLALGSNTKVSGERSVALGSNITGLQTKGSVVLGDNSSSVKGTLGAPVPVATVEQATINTSSGETVTYSGFAGQVSDEGQYVSIGRMGRERQLKNVAAGNISHNSTDAVNGSQLYSLGVRLAENTNTHFHTGNGNNVGGKFDNNSGELMTAAGAVGKDSLAAGISAKALNEKTTSVGTDAKAVAKGSVAVGANALAGVTRADYSGYEAAAKDYSDKETIYKAKSAELSQATADYDQAVANYNDAAAEAANVTANYNAAVTARNSAKSAYDAAVANPATAPADLVAKKTAYENAERALALITDLKNEAVSYQGVAEAAKNSAETKKTGLEGEVATAGSVRDTAKNAYQDKLNSLEIQNAVMHDSIAIGTDATSSSDGSIAIGKNADATGTHSLALGSNSRTEKGNTYAIGTNAKALFDRAYAIGNEAEAKAASAYAIGDKAQAFGRSNIAIGTRALTGDKNGTEDNNQSAATAIGYAAQATAKDATAIGRSSNASGQEAYAIGLSSVASNENAIAMGTQATASGSMSMAMGKKAEASAEKSLALGSNSSATNANSVALGSGAVDKVFTSVDTGSIATVNNGTFTYSGFAGEDKGIGVVSVGKDGETTRQIVNVAPGEVSASSTDAVNGSQLYAVANRVESGWQVAGNDKTRVANISPEEKVSFLNGNHTTAQVVADGTGATVKYNTVTQALKVEDGKVALDGNATDGSGTGTAQDSSALATAGDVMNAINSAAWNVDSATASGKEKKAVKAGDTVKFESGDNIELTQAGTAFTYALKKDITVDSVTVNNGPVLNSAGINMGGKKITNLAAGTEDGDAVNKSQLDKAAAGVKTEVAAGSNVQVEETKGTAGQSIYTVHADKAVVEKEGDGLKLTTTPETDPNGTTTTKYKLGLNTVSLATDADGKVEDVADGDKNKLVTAGDIADAINSAAWNVDSATASGKEKKAVKAGDTVKFESGDNIELTQAG